MQLSEDQKVSVEMHAEEKQKSDVKYSLFSGALDYHTLYNEYKSKVCTFLKIILQTMFFNVFILLYTVFSLNLTLN